jgi:hypothetical protein
LAEWWGGGGFSQANAAPENARANAETKIADFFMTSSNQFVFPKGSRKIS